MSLENFDAWLTSNPADRLNDYPTQCDKHNAYQPCAACQDEEADYQWQMALEEREAPHDRLP